RLRRHLGRAELDELRVVLVVGPHPDLRVGCRAGPLDALLQGAGEVTGVDRDVGDGAGVHVLGPLLGDLFLHVVHVGGEPGESALGGLGADGAHAEPGHHSSPSCSSSVMSATVSATVCRNSAICGATGSAGSTVRVPAVTSCSPILMTTGISRSGSITAPLRLGVMCSRLAGRSR